MLQLNLFLVETVSESGVLEKLTDIYNVIKDFFGDVASLGSILGGFILDLPSYFVWLPSEIITILMFAFTLLVALRIAGRSS